MVEGQAELLGDRHNTESRQKNKKQERMRALTVYSCISLCLLVHNHLLPIYREWIVQLEWELACVLIWAWENKLPAVLECGRVGIFSIMACPEALNHTWRYLVGLYEVQGWTKETLGWCTLASDRMEWDSTNMPDQQQRHCGTWKKKKKQNEEKLWQYGSIKRPRNSLQGSNDFTGMWYCDTHPISSPPLPEYRRVLWAGEGWGIKHPFSNSREPTAFLWKCRFWFNSPGWVGGPESRHFHFFQMMPVPAMTQTLLWVARVKKLLGHLG